MSAYREDGLKLHNEERRRREQRKARWLVSDAPAELWMRKQRDGRYHETHYDDEPEIMRYVRADLYEAALARLAVVRSWNEAPCLEPLPPDAGSHEQQPGEAMVAALRALKEASCLEPLPRI